MLETKYGLKYAMPHTLVHIVDNSMYNGPLPTIVADDPSLYTSIVVSGAPMGVDNEIITIDRSDVLNVAYGMSDLTSSDILKYGQAVTYPSDLLAQGVPVKFLRVTPEDSTYAFSCLLVQWRWDPTDNKIHVRFKTTDNMGNDGLPIGQVLSSFKNTSRLNMALVKGFKDDSVTDESGTWKQRVFMTFISAGRGKNYNKYRYAINPTQQGRKPANTRYVFSTIDSTTDAVVERFYASLINENNANRIDAIENVNVQIGKRVKGSSVLVPTVNESAVHELYRDYYDKLIEMDNSQIYPEGSSDKWIKEVKTTLNENTFDMVYGKYLYNGDSDVFLPYYQVDMFDLDIPRLDKSSRLYVYLDANDGSISDYINNPIVLNDTLTSKTVAVSGSAGLTSYYVGDMFLTDTNAKSLSLITGINQYSGSVTSIKISGCKLTFNGVDSVESFAGYVSVPGTDITASAVVETVRNDLLLKGKIKPIVDTKASTTTTTVYKPSFVLVEFNQLTNSTGLTTFGIVKIVYNDKTETDTSVTINDSECVLYKTPAEIFSVIAFPSTAITNLATELPTFPEGASDSEKARLVNDGTTSRFWQTAGSTVIDINGVFGESSKGRVYVNTQIIDSTSYDSPSNRILIPETSPFMVGKCPTQLTVNRDVVGSSYDVIIYKNSDQQSSSPVTWTVNGGKASDVIVNGYNKASGSGELTTPADIVEVNLGTEDEPYFVQFTVADVITTQGGEKVVLGNNVVTDPESGVTTKITPGTYPCVNITSRLTDPTERDGEHKYVKKSITSGTSNIPTDFYSSPIVEDKDNTTGIPKDDYAHISGRHIVYQHRTGGTGTKEDPYTYTDRTANEPWYAYDDVSADDDVYLYALLDGDERTAPDGNETVAGWDVTLPAWSATDNPYFYKNDQDEYVQVADNTDWETNKFYVQLGPVPTGWGTSTSAFYVDDEAVVSEGKSSVTFTGTGTVSAPILPAFKTGEGSTTYYTRSDKEWFLETFRDSGNLTVIIASENIEASVADNRLPDYIQRYIISGTQGSIFRYNADTSIVVPTNYYSNTYGINPNSEAGGVGVHSGYAGFFDDDISDIEFKWKYSELLVRAFKGELDARILSPARCPAKFMFDAGYNTIVGQTILSYMTYRTVDIINASTIYTDDEKEAILLDNSLISTLPDISKGYIDIDVKGAMYWLMEFRCYQGIPEDKRPIGPGSGLSLHLDSGITEGNTAVMVKNSFTKRFTNPNASWDIGGYTSSGDGITYTFIKQIVANLFRHIKQNTVNKPYTGKYTNISADNYVSFFPDLGDTSWEEREELYKSGGNNWIQDVNGNLQRQSQRTLYREGDTSDLIQESNMRTLSQLVYMLQNKINTYLLEYNDDGVLKTLKDDVDNMFSNWVGTLVEALDIQFERDINPLDGGDIVVCYCKVTFRGLILRVPIIVNVQRRTES